MRPLLLSFLALSAALAPPASPAAQGGRGERRPPAPGKEAPAAEERLADEDWRALVARDAEVRFGERSATEARARLSLPNLSHEARAAAWVALGCVGAQGERIPLEMAARSAQGAERRGAVLALGELGAGSTALLTEIADGADPLLAECALLALLRDGRHGGARRVAELAADPKDPRNAAAGELLAFARDPATAPPARAAVLLLRLRYEAAREFGLLGGEAWRARALELLGSDATALREIVLGSLPVLRRAGVPDHLLPELAAGGGEARLRAAVAVMPRELSRAVENALWTPRDLGEWRVLLDEVQARGSERLAPELLRAAQEQAPLRWRAVHLLALAGEQPDEALLEIDASTLPVRQRIDLCDALGALDDPSWLARHSALRVDPEPNVSAAALVAGVRLGAAADRREARSRLEGEEGPARAALVRTLCRLARDPLAGQLLEERLPDVKGAERLEIATALALSGRLSGRATVRAALSTDPPPRGREAVKLVRALARNGTAEDVELFRALFPRPDDRELDLELARTLIGLRDPMVEPLLRSALWRAPFHVSVLAGGLLLEVSGPQALVIEIENAPSEASSSDLRRAGWAAGEWGGNSVVDQMAERLPGGATSPAVQGAWLGALAARTR